MASDNKSFHLRWNNHLSNLGTLLEYLYNQQSFVDVSLSCSDGLIRAHKLVLSACSPYFDTIFRENPCKHPTVILRGISLREMQLIIEYMYVGSVDIPENELPSVLEIANELHVKGLAQDPIDEENNSDKRESTINNLSTQEFKTESINGSETKESFSMSNSSLQNSIEDTENISPMLNKEDSNSENQVPVDNNDKTICGIMGIAQVQINMDECGNLGEENKKHADHNFTFEYNTEDRSCYPPDLFCSMCNKGFLTKQNMKRHMQTHTGVKPHQCNYCNLSFLRLSHLQRHHRVHTGERPFQCDQCEKQFSRSDKLKQHISQHHSGVVVPKQPKQRGRPRKIPLNIPLNLASSPNRKLSSENLENMNNIPSYQTLQQLYNIPNTLTGISVVQ